MHDSANAHMHGIAGQCSHGHDLALQRRRDRINEKMRALQELIPNCNKARTTTGLIMHAPLA